MIRPSVILLCCLAASTSACKEKYDLSTEAENASQSAAAEAAAQMQNNNGEQTEAAAAAAIQEPYQPKRTPEFDFAPGGPISDEQLAEYYVELEFAVDDESVGVVVLDFWPEKAPLTVRNYLRYCAEGFYEGLTFHRILRDFMVQGGDPTATGSGDGPYGQVKAEFSDDLKYSHEYGVISMARGPSEDSASCQFFLCSDSAPNTWNLNGSYSSFGKMVSGITALEAIANVPTTRAPNGEMAKPTKKASILRTTVKKGSPPQSDEKIARPRPPLDLKGEAEKVVVQHVLVAFNNGRIPGVTRSQEEAEKLAQEVLEKAQGGADFAELVRAHSADPIRPGDTNPGVYRLLNNGVRDVANERAGFLVQQRLGKEWQEFQLDIRRRQQAGELDSKQVNELVAAKREELMAQMPTDTYRGRGEMVPGFGDTCFSLKVGEVGVAEYHPSNSPFGWHVIKRLK